MQWFNTFCKDLFFNFPRETVYHKPLDRKLSFNRVANYSEITFCNSFIE